MIKNKGDKLDMNLNSFKNNLLYLVPITLFLLLWEIAGQTAQTPLFPPLSKVTEEFGSLLHNGVLLKGLGASFGRVLIGYILGSLAGLSVGVIMGVN